MNTTQTGVTNAERRTHIETVLAHYPAISEDELALLIRWFKRDATALDVGMISSNPDVHDAYVQFRSAHLDKLRVKDYALIVGIISTLGAFLAYGVIAYA